MKSLTEHEWAMYVLDSPLFLELLEDDFELLQVILEPLSESHTYNA